MNTDGLTVAGFHRAVNGELRTFEPRTSEPPTRLIRVGSSSGLDGRQKHINEKSDPTDNRAKAKGRFADHPFDTAVASRPQTGKNRKYLGTLRSL